MALSGLGNLACISFFLFIFLNHFPDIDKWGGLWCLSPNFIIKVDALYIRGMLNNPNIQQNATINHWTAGILLFSFTLVHVPSECIAANGVSQ